MRGSGIFRLAHARSVRVVGKTPTKDDTRCGPVVLSPKLSIEHVKDLKIKGTPANKKKFYEEHSKTDQKKSQDFDELTLSSQAQDLEQIVEYVITHPGILPKKRNPQLFHDRENNANVDELCEKLTRIGLGDLLNKLARLAFVER